MQGWHCLRLPEEKVLPGKANGDEVGDGADGHHGCRRGRGGGSS